MKKLLSILAAVGLSATASTAVVACGSSKKSDAGSKLNQEYTGSKNTIKKELLGKEVSDGDKKEISFELSLTLPKGYSFDVVSGDYVLDGQIVNDLESYAVNVVKADKQNVGTVLSDDDPKNNEDNPDFLTDSILVKAKDSDELKNNSHADPEEEGTVISDKNLTLNVTFNLPETAFKNGECHLGVIVTYAKDASATDDNDPTITVAADLYDLTIKNN